MLPCNDLLALAVSEPSFYVSRQPLHDAFFMKSFFEASIIHLSDVGGMLMLCCWLAAGGLLQVPADGPRASAEQTASVESYPADPGTSSGPGECVM
jgi:hypothetical protein